MNFGMNKGWGGIVLEFELIGSTKTLLTPETNLLDWRLSHWLCDERNWKYSWWGVSLCLFSDKVLGGLWVQS
jgi:hypothetical protein